MAVIGWTKQAVEVLIDAYKDEPCLYATNNPNYHNKHLRNEALKRISAGVSTIRPNSSEKECSVKIHNLRNQFNTENAKVRGSIKSGIGTENVYRPNLWYYESLKFLEEHVIPRKSRSSQLPKVKVNTSTYSTQEVLDEMSSENDHMNIVNEILGENEYIRVVNEISGEDEYISVNAVNENEEIETNDDELWAMDESTTDTVVPYTTRQRYNDTTTQELHATKRNPRSTSRTSTVLRNKANTPGTSGLLNLPPRASPVPSTASSSALSEEVRTSGRAKKRKTQNDDAYVNAIQSIAQSLKTPSPTPTPTPTNNVGVSDSEDTVNNCMKFLASLIRELKCPQVKLDTMNTLIQTVINVSTMNLE